MAVERDEEAEAVLLEGVQPQLASRPTRRAALLTASLLSVSVATLSLIAWQREGGSKGQLARVSSRPKFVELAEEEDLCAKMPYLKLLKVKSNNLGGKGPQTDAPEGLIYEATPHNEGLGNITDVELHFHVVSKDAFTDEEAAEQKGSYQPAWPTQNGIHGGFAVVNLKAGTNVTLQVHGYDPASKKDLVVPRGAMTFFDLDTGAGGNNSVEYIKVDSYSAYYVTNETEVKVSHGDDGSTTFTASTEGTGKDNPEDPLALTVLQKNRAFSLEFENDSGVIIQLGVSPGKTARVFSFVLRPALRCAQTVLGDGTILDASSPDAPITVVRNAGGQARPLLALLLGLALASSPWHQRR